MEKQEQILDANHTETLASKRKLELVISGDLQMEKGAADNINTNLSYIEITIVYQMKQGNNSDFFGKKQTEKIPLRGIEPTV